MSRLIERAFKLAHEDLKLNWHEKEGTATNPLIKECYEAVDGFGNPEMMDDDKFAWCSCYVNRKIQQAGGRGTRSAAARSWLRWGREVELKDVKPGDIVIFSRPPSKWQGHVGFVEKVEATTLQVLGGNQHNTVDISSFKKGNRILGFRTSKD